MCAAKHGCQECMEVLLRHLPSQQVSVVDQDGNTALMLAAFGGHQGCVEVLLCHDLAGQVGIVNLNGETALVLAAKACLEDMRQQETCKRIIRTLIVKGDTLPINAFAMAEEAELVWSVIREGMSLSMVPSYANEAVVGLTLEVIRNE